jgi:hypothetical protein
MQPIEEVVVDWSSERAPVYSDYVVVSNRGVPEFSITFCVLSNEVVQRNSKGKVVAKAKVGTTIQMNASTFFKLLTSMSGSWKIFLAAVGATGKAPTFELAAPREQGNG